MILTIALVIILFSLLVIAHELGHFMVARRNGVKVDEFGLGFPPKLFGKTVNGTLYSLNLFLFGGFVRLKGEDQADKAQDSLSAQSYRVKSKIVLAGVAVNFSIAYFIILLLMVFGMPSILPSGFISVGPIKPYKIETSALKAVAISKDSAAENAGITTGTEIISVNGTAITSEDQLKSITSSNAGNVVEITTRPRGGEPKTLQVQLGSDASKGYLGLAAQSEQRAFYNPLVAIIGAIIATFYLAVLTISAFGDFLVGLFSKAQVSNNVAGPVGIVSIFGSVMEYGWRYILAFTASISLSLAVINSLPIPALDGGRFALMSITRLGVKIKPETEALMHWLGFGFLIILIIIVTISDISRL